MSRSHSSTFQSTLDREIGEIAVTVAYDYTAGSPGKLTGPYEDSYPPEAFEIDITSVEADTGEIAITDDERATLEDRAIQHAEDAGEPEDCCVVGHEECDDRDTETDFD